MKTLLEFYMPLDKTPSSSAPSAASSLTAAASVSSSSSSSSSSSPAVLSSSFSVSSSSSETRKSKRSEAALASSDGKKKRKISLKKLKDQEIASFCTDILLELTAPFAFYLSETISKPRAFLTNPQEIFKTLSESPEALNCWSEVVSKFQMPDLVKPLQFINQEVQTATESVLARLCASMLSKEPASSCLSSKSSSSSSSSIKLLKKSRSKRPLSNLSRQQQPPPPGLSESRFLSAFQKSKAQREWRIVPGSNIQSWFDRALPFQQELYIPCLLEKNSLPAPGRIEICVFLELSDAQLFIPQAQIDLWRNIAATEFQEKELSLSAGERESRADEIVADYFHSEFSRQFSYS